MTADFVLMTLTIYRRVKSKVPWQYFTSGSVDVHPYQQLLFANNLTLAKISSFYG